MRFCIKICHGRLLITDTFQRISVKLISLLSISSTTLAGVRICPFLIVEICLSVIFLIRDTEEAWSRQSFLRLRVSSESGEFGVYRIRVIK